jgi:hypothetical protein
MARINIKDLPKDMRISPEEMKKVRGGAMIKNILLENIAGVGGESSDDKHENWIEILSDSDQRS